MKNNRETILLVDDEELIRENFGKILTIHGYKVVTAFDNESAIAAFKNYHPAAVLLDINLPDGNGMEVHRKIKMIDSSVPVIFVTAYGDIPSAVEAMKEGAYDFITKPPDFDRLIITLGRAVEKRNLEKNIRDLHAAYQSSLEFMLGNSPAMRGIISQLQQIALSDFSVMIKGETGTGKTYLANVIHSLSKRNTGPFVKVSVGSIPDTLAESELFGFEKGAFTGAERMKRGYFEIADNGTIFLDDVDNISLFVQGKLLSVIEDKRIYHIGSTKAIPVNIRLISATNKNISDAGGSTFRQDLLFRLGEFVIHLPPLRERPEDIIFFSRKFLIETCAELSKQVGELAPDAIPILTGYPWPGNLRQLKNVIRRAVLLSHDGSINSANLRVILTMENAASTPTETTALSIKDAEKSAVRRALELSGGKKTRAAALLQIDYKTLLRKMKEYGI